MTDFYDTIIVGGGPAGSAAGVYAARKKMKALLLTESFGGQSIVSDGIENWIGSIKISGIELAQLLEKHVRAYSNEIEIKMPEKAIGVKEIEGGLEIESDQGNKYKTKTLIAVAGGRHRKLGVSGEDNFGGKGVSYCSTCDAAFFKEKDVAVIGSGNSGLEAVVDLFPFAKKIYLLTRGPKLRGDAATQEEVKNSEKVTIIHNTDTNEIIGEKFVTGLKYKDRETGEESKIDLQGIFIEIGTVPNSEFLGELVKKDERGEVITDHNLGTTSHERIFAAGDITNEAYKQNNIAVGDAIKATLSAHNFLIGRKD